MRRSWRWVAGDGYEWKIEKELKVGRNWRWVAGDGEEWKIERS